MRHRSNSEQYGRWIKLVKKTNPKTGRKHYSVIVDPYEYTSGYINTSRTNYENMAEAWRNHFDPTRTRGMKTGLSWKFTNKEQAVQLITMALLKWGDRYVAKESN